MTAVFLERIDAAPLADDDFSFSFNSWASVFVDTINETITTIENNFNGINDGLLPGAFTQAQILAMAPNLADGVILYCTDHVPTPVYVGKIAGALVQFTTTAFP